VENRKLANKRNEIKTDYHKFKSPWSQCSGYQNILWWKWFGTSKFWVWSERV